MRTLCLIEGGRGSEEEEEERFGPLASFSPNKGIFTDCCTELLKKIFQKNFKISLMGYLRYLKE